MPVITKRATRLEARYTPEGGIERCGYCRHFVSQGSCNRIIGPVSPRGWCKFFSQQITHSVLDPGGQSFVGGGPPGVALDISFMTSGTLDPRITFTRGSVATYFDATGTMQTASSNTPRWDYNPSTLQLNGLLIEEARTNLWHYSGDFSNPSTGLSGSPPPVVTGNQLTAPDGTTTAAKMQLATCTGTNGCQGAQPWAVTANPYAFTAWLRGAVGGEVLYLMTTPDAVTWYRTQCTLTTSWQRFSLVTPALTAATWYFQIGFDRRDAGQTNTTALTCFVWGVQVEQGAFATSYIPTTAAAVTRSQEQCTIPSANMGFYTTPSGSWAMEYICTKSNAGGSTFLLGQHNNIAGPVPMYLNSTQALAQYDGVAVMGTTNAAVDGVVNKVATTRANTNAATACLNAGPVGSASTLTNGYPLLVNGMDFLRTSEVNAAQMKAGYVRRVRYWPRILTTAELQQVTT